MLLHNWEQFLLNKNTFFFLLELLRQCMNTMIMFYYLLRSGMIWFFFSWLYIYHTYFTFFVLVCPGWLIRTLMMEDFWRQRNRFVGNITGNIHGDNEDVSLKRNILTLLLDGSLLIMCSYKAVEFVHKKRFAKC